MTSDNNTGLKMPGRAPTPRALHFIWLLDCSGSMQENGKIQALNTAIREAVQLLRQLAVENPNAALLMRAVCFGTGAQWHIAQPTPVENFRWQEVQAGGVTDMGRALRLVADELKAIPIAERGLRPVLVLITDGWPTDDFSAGLRELLSTPWGEKASRIAIAVGEEAQRPQAQDVLTRFIGNAEVAPLAVKNVDELKERIILSSTRVTQENSQPGSTQPARGTAYSGSDQW